MAVICKAFTNLSKSDCSESESHHYCLEVGYLLPGNLSNRFAMKKLVVQHPQPLGDQLVAATTCSQKKDQCNQQENTTFPNHMQAAFLFLILCDWAIKHLVSEDELKGCTKGSVKDKRIILNCDSSKAALGQSKNDKYAAGNLYNRYNSSGFEVYFCVCVFMEYVCAVLFPSYYFMMGTATENSSNIFSCSHSFSAITMKSLVRM